MNRSEHERLFKQRLTTFFIEFLELFVPKLVAVIRAASIEFLDKEILTDVSSAEQQLNRLNWRDYVRQPDRIASALMVKMKISHRTARR